MQYISRGKSVAGFKIRFFIRYEIVGDKGDGLGCSEPLQTEHGIVSTGEISLAAEYLDWQTARFFGSSQTVPEIEAVWPRATAANLSTNRSR